jgi:Fe-S oxidoreductase
MGLLKVKRWIKNCIGCGLCIGPGPIYPFREGGIVPEEEGIPSHKCPMYEHYKFVSASPRGLLYLAATIAYRNFPLTEDLVERAYQCLTCGVCNDLCYINKTSAIHALREEIVEHGMGPLPANKEVDKSIRTHNNVFGLPPKERLKWTGGLNLSSEGDFLFFAGCYDSYRYPQEARDVVRIFRQAGLKPAHLGPKEICCGAHAFWDGDTELAKAKAKALVGAIERTGHTEVVVTCADCYRVLVEDYEILLGPLPFKVTHFSVKVAEIFSHGDLRPKHEIRETVTYHDPCRLFNHFMIQDEPRTVIKSIPGIDFVELREGLRWSSCCGSGGMVSQHAFPKFSEEVTIERLNRAKSLAPTLVTNCPHCFDLFRKVSKDHGINIIIRPLTKLVSMSLGL